MRVHVDSPTQHSIAVEQSAAHQMSNITVTVGCRPRYNITAVLEYKCTRYPVTPPTHGLGAGSWDPLAMTRRSTAVFDPIAVPLYCRGRNSFTYGCTHIGFLLSTSRALMGFRVRASHMRPTHSRNSPRAQFAWFAGGRIAWAAARCAACDDQVASSSTTCR